MTFQDTSIKAKTAELRFEFTVTSGRVSVRLHDRKLLDSPVDDIAAAPQLTEIPFYGSYVSLRESNAGTALDFCIIHEGMRVGRFEIGEDGRFEDLDTPGIDTLRYEA